MFSFSLLIVNATFSPVKNRMFVTPVLSKIIFEEASVACPHNGISFFGEKNRILYVPFSVFSFTNAVSENPISFAMSCIFSLLNSLSKKQTPAGFPLKGSLVNESTKYVFILIYSCFVLTIIFLSNLPLVGMLV